MSSLKIQTHLDLETFFSCPEQAWAWLRCSSSSPTFRGAQGCSSRDSDPLCKPRRHVCLPTGVIREAGSRIKPHCAHSRSWGGEQGCVHLPRRERKRGTFRMAFDEGSILQGSQTWRGGAGRLARTASAPCPSSHPSSLAQRPRLVSSLASSKTGGSGLTSEPSPC